MCWQKRFERYNPDQDIEQNILEIHKDHKDFGYRQIYGELKKQGLLINLSTRKKFSALSKTLISR